MSFWKIAWRNMQQRALASSLTGLSMALGVALMILVIVIHEVTVEQFESDAQGYHLIVGGSSGGDAQLVMNTVFHIGTPPYPIPYHYYQQFLDGPYAPYTQTAVPYCIGDSFHRNGSRFRVVATTPDLFDKIAYGANDDGTDKRYEFQEGGRNFRADRFFEAVLGSVVASKTGLKVGDTFEPTHGLSDGGDKHIEFEIVGILKPTGTSNDRALFANMEGFFLLDGHALPIENVVEKIVEDIAENPARASAGNRATVSVGNSINDSVGNPVGDNEEESSALTAAAVEAKLSETNATDQLASRPHRAAGTEDPNRGFLPLPEARREVTSILVLCKDDISMMTLDHKINKGKDRTAMAVKPGYFVQDMLDNIIGPVRLVLLVLTILIIVVAGISILVSIYNSMSERSHDIAVMRALGASRAAVMGIILAESILLSLLGGIAGVLLGHAVMGLVSPMIESQAGIVLKFWQFNWQESLLIPGLVAFASLVGFLPALTAYRTDVGRALAGGR